MAIKRVFGKTSEKHKTCLRCGQKIEERLRDDRIYTCERCGQQHFVDIYADSMILTVAERPEFRKRNEARIEEEQKNARAALIRKMLIRRAEAKKQKEAAPEATREAAEEQNEE